jgi:DNA-directed RNA polymerase subunit RPC12/RpoP
MTKMMGRYKCDKCGQEMIAEDGKDHRGEECSRCKQGKAKRMIEVDIEGNMKRINAEIALAKARAALP